MASHDWEYWRLTGLEDGRVEWLAATKPGARATIDRQKVWTLIPRRVEFIANWYVTEDHLRASGDSLWLHELIEIDEAREVALEVLQPSGADLARLSRPETCLTLDQIDRHAVEKLLGNRVAAVLFARR